MAHDVRGIWGIEFLPVYENPMQRKMALQNRVEVNKAWKTSRKKALSAQQHIPFEAAKPTMKWAFPVFVFPLYRAKDHDPL